jgi:putative selenate reductase FAD-binding subunit
MFVSIMKPDSLAEARKLKNDLGSGSCFVAGGTHVNSREFDETGKHAIYLGNLLPDGVKVGLESIELGARTTFQELIETSELPEVVSRACHLLVSRNIRNMATLGGHIACGNPTGVLTVPLLALHARLLLAEDREITLQEYLQQPGDNLIVKVLIPHSSIRGHHGLSHFRRSGNDRPLLLSAACEDVNGNFTLSFGGGSEIPLVFSKLRTDISDEFVRSWIDTHMSPEPSIQAGAGFKLTLAKELAVRAYHEACQDGGRNER